MFLMCRVSRSWRTGRGVIRMATSHPLGSGPMRGDARGGNQLATVRFLTVAEVARIMRVSKMTVYRLVHSGEMSAVRVGRSYRVPESAVNAYLKEALTDTA